MKTGDNIRKRADGRYEARYPKGRNEQGKLVYGCCYGRTYEEAEAKRAAILRPAVREMNLLILGAGSHGAEIYELAQNLHVFKKIAFLDDDLTKTAVIGPCRDFARYVEEYPVAIAAVGDWSVRYRWLEQLVDAGFIIPVLIHPAAVVSSSATIGYGSVICARATVGAGTEIGVGSIIASGATIERHVKLPEGSHIECGRVVRL